MRDELTLRAAQILAAYREKCSEPAPAGQLILPEFAKYYIVLTNQKIQK
jgi:hypothetical protein